VSASANGGDGFNSSITEVNNASKVYDNINLIGRGGGGGGAGGNSGRNGSSGGGVAHNQTNGGIGTQGNTRWNGTSYIAGGFNGAKLFFGSRGSGGGGAIDIVDTYSIGSGGDGFHGKSGYSFRYNFGLSVGQYVGAEDRLYLVVVVVVLFLIPQHM